MRKLVAAARSTAVVSLGTIGGLHVLWAFGSPWPASDRRALGNAIGGFDDVPGPGACLAVATALVAAAGCVAGVENARLPTARLSSVGISTVLLYRALLGRSGLMPNARRSPVFAELDRRVYAPVCLVLGVLALAGAIRD